jgi:pSer/pThr/pTyr-binding forkhead associated (FHA) protein
MKSELIPLDGSPPIPIDRDVTVVGRREFCDVVVPHPSLSKRHCVLVRTDGLLVVRDLVSTNGTKVNGQRVSWAALLPNDRLTLGKAKFRVYLGPDDTASPSERFRRGEPVGAGVTSTVGLGGFTPPTPPAGMAADPSKRAHATTVGFPAPSPLSMPALTSPPATARGSTDPDADVEVFDDDDLEILDDGFEPIDDDDDEIIELD